MIGLGQRREWHSILPQVTQWGEGKESWRGSHTVHDKELLTSLLSCFGVFLLKNNNNMEIIVIGNDNDNRETHAILGTVINSLYKLTHLSPQ